MRIPSDPQRDPIGAEAARIVERSLVLEPVSVPVADTVEDAMNLLRLAARCAFRKRRLDETPEQSTNGCSHLFCVGPECLGILFLQIDSKCFHVGLIPFFRH